VDTELDPVESGKPKREPTWITCRCGARWTALNVAHCGSCHESFSGPSNFDLHRTSAGEFGACKHPTDVLNREGYRLLFFRDGVWRGPELSEEEKEIRFGNRRVG
jgi:hypothetical protein